MRKNGWPGGRVRVAEGDAPCMGVVWCLDLRQVRGETGLRGFPGPNVLYKYK